MLMRPENWHWEAMRLGPHSWRDPRSGWNADQILDVMAYFVAGSPDMDKKATLIERILPKRALLEYDRLELDASGALRPHHVTLVDGDLLAWVVESLWGRTGTTEDLLAGWTLGRIREDGAIAHLCVPLLPAAPALTIIACSIAGEDRESTLGLASRLTWLASLSPDAIGRGEAATRRTAPSDRQRAILQAMAQGLTNRQIASRINFSESTVRMESIAIYRFYGVHSRAAAVAAARSCGHLDRDDCDPWMRASSH